MKIRRTLTATKIIRRFEATANLPFVLLMYERADGGHPHGVR